MYMNNKPTDKQIGYISYLVRSDPIFRSLLPPRIVQARPNQNVDYTTYDFEQKVKDMDIVAVGDMIRAILDKAIPEEVKIKYFKDFIK